MGAQLRGDEFTKDMEIMARLARTEWALAFRAFCEMGDGLARGYLV